MVFSSKRWQDHKFRDHENESVMALSCVTSPQQLISQGPASGYFLVSPSTARGVWLGTFIHRLAPRFLKDSVPEVCSSAIQHGLCIEPNVAPELLTAPQKKNLQSFHGSPCYKLTVFTTVAAEERCILKNIKVICIICFHQSECGMKQELFLGVSPECPSPPCSSGCGSGGSAWGSSGCRQ